MFRILDKYFFALVTLHPCCDVTYIVYKCSLSKLVLTVVSSVQYTKQFNNSYPVWLNKEDTHKVIWALIQCQTMTIKNRNGFYVMLSSATKPSKL